LLNDLSSTTASRHRLMAPRGIAAAMMAGLLCWPSLHWQLALAYADASPNEREAITAIFDASNSYLGNFIGEFLGELLLNSFSCALPSSSPARRHLHRAGCFWPALLPACLAAWPCCAT
jgi:hypothetical protein